MPEDSLFEEGAFTDLVNLLINEFEAFHWYYDPVNAPALPALHKLWGISDEQAKALASRSAPKIQALVNRELESRGGASDASGPFTHVMSSFGP